MTRYPVWRYVVIALALAFGLVYTLPNFFGESPAVQISSQKATVKVDDALEARALAALKAAGIEATGVVRDPASVKLRFASTDVQFKAREVLEKALNTDPADPTYITALNLLSSSPDWLTSLRALPMYLGLDLRGGVHFLMQIDTQSAIDKKAEQTASEIRSLLREKNVRHSGIDQKGDTVTIDFREDAIRQRAIDVLTAAMPDMGIVPTGTDAAPKLSVRFKEAALRRFIDESVQQNITTLSNRVNELAVAEPVIQRQGVDRIVVQLPGVQDTARAKGILGRTATLEARLVDLSAEASQAVLGQGAVPFGSELFKQGRGAPVVLKREPIFTGQQLTGANATFDENQQPAVAVNLDDAGGRRLREVSRANIKKPMAVVLFEKGRGEVLTVATIQSELGSRFQITGMGSPQNSNDLALLLRAGALAAPMDIIEERTIGPSLGAENIQKGFHSVGWGFLMIAVFMTLYYTLFGLISTLALGFNLLLLVALLSLLQATLSLPGMAAIALTLGMAIDANVLINERIREELRAGATPQVALTNGYDRAWATILDSNITTLIAGVALLAFGSGPVKGFAIVHVLGILTSMFSAVFVSRGLVALWYGRRRKLVKLDIGQIWKPGAGGKGGATKAGA
ncbi:MAG: protein translocase subunit SecD [Lautropia sp.]